MLRSLERKALLLIFIYPCVAFPIYQIYEFGRRLEGFKNIILYKVNHFKFFYLIKNLRVR